MPHEEMLALLSKVRAVLDRYIFDEINEVFRDDVAAVCMAIDDDLPDKTRVPIKRAAQLTRELKEALA